MWKSSSCAPAIPQPSPALCANWYRLRASCQLSVGPVVAFRVGGHADGFQLDAGDLHRESECITALAVFVIGAPRLKIGERMKVQQRDAQRGQLLD